MQEVIYTGDPQEAAEEFSRRIVAELGDVVDSVVLFGSVARGEPGLDYKIEALVVAPKTKETREAISLIAWDLYEESVYTMPLFELHMDADELHRTAAIDPRYNWDLFSEGKVLYDNGTFKRLLRKASSGIGGNGVG